MAIRLRLGDHVRANASIGAGPVLDEHRLSQVRLDRRRELAGDDVGGTARREGHNDTNRSRWEVRGGLGAGGDSHDQETSNNSDESANDVRPSSPLLPKPCHKHVPPYCLAQVKLAASFAS